MFSCRACVHFREMPLAMFPQILLFRVNIVQRGVVCCNKQCGLDFFNIVIPIQCPCPY